MADEMCLDKRAAVLRDKAAPLPADKVLAAWNAIPRDPPDYNGVGPAKDCKRLLKQHAVIVGNIAGVCFPTPCAPVVPSGTRVARAYPPLAPPP